MKILRGASGLIMSVSIVLGSVGVLSWPESFVLAATSPSLGTAADYSILAGSEVTNTGATTISGNVGISPGIGAPPHYTGFGTVTLGGVIHDADAAALTAQSDRDLAYTALASQGCDTDYGAVTKELAGEILTPGVYCADSFHLTSGTLTLNGGASDVYIFKSASDLIITGSASEVVFTGGGLACNVWWRVVSTATLDAGSALVGNILASTSITFAAGSSLDGRALASTAAVTLDSAAITGPTCAAAVSPAQSSRSNQGTINVVKVVVNDNGGTSTVDDFQLFVSDTPVISGDTTTFAANSTEYTVHETANSEYTSSFAGDCDANGVFNMYQGDEKICVLTNDDIGTPAIPPVPPLIDVVKVPSPLALPDGPGDVNYTYTLTNIGTVPVTDITMVGDTCSPIILTSGDSDGDQALDLTETWLYECSTSLSETHTNTVVATGWANGLSASDIASATVVVGVPVIPPLIHVTKVPSPLALSAGGGTVTYTEKITNPGTVALSNVTLTDDKCSPMNYVSGDTDDDSLLDVTETWTYTCSSTLSATTTNTASASGTANGLTVRDTAIATVVVAASVPALPNTGFAPGINTELLGSALAVIFMAGLSFYLGRRKQIN